MKRLMKTAMGMAVVLVLLLPGMALAEGTPAGTVITNEATATYDVGGVSGLSETSDPDTIVVAELLDLSLTWSDGAPIPVAPGDTNEVLTFMLTNTGNGTDVYSLTHDNSMTGSDDFNPDHENIYLDENGNGQYDSGTDSLYGSGNKPELAADASLYIFVLNNIPTSPMPGDGDTGDTKLIATSDAASSATPSLTAGGVLAGGGENGADAVVGNSNGTAEDIGTYLVSNVTVDITKSSQILNDPVFGTQPVPGATIQYTIEVNVTGGGTAEDVVVTDEIPENTTYETGTLQLDGGPLTDGSGDDDGEVGGSPETVTVRLGDLVEADSTKTIIFEVTID